MNAHETSGAERRWTQTDVNELRSRSHEGEEAAGIALVLGRTEQAVRLMARRLALRLAE